VLEGTEGTWIVEDKPALLVEDGGKGFPCTDEDAGGFILLVDDRGGGFPCTDEDAGRFILLVDEGGGFAGAVDDAGRLTFLLDDFGGDGGVGDAGEANSVLEAPQDHTPPIVTVAEVVEVLKASSVSAIFTY
jgi:hypothetical protein